MMLGGIGLEELDCKAVRAARDEKLMDQFLQESEPFIFRCVYFSVHKRISKSDDEWSVASLAFFKAVRDYSAAKGGFANFARLVIRRSLIDYARSQAKFHSETAVDPSALDSESGENGTEEKINFEVREAVCSRASEADDSLRLEIEAADQTFASYGFSFFDLADCSPKAEKTKKSCAAAAAYIIRHPVLLSEMRASKTLPLKIIEKNGKVPRKILERHRKYIIAAIEIITGDFPCLAEYMRYIQEELKR